MATNGESKIKLRDLTFTDKLDILIEALAELSDKVDELIEGQAELGEKVGNLTLEGDGFQVDRYDS